MNYDDKRIAGLLVFVGGVQFVLAVIISEATYSGYSVGKQVMSDLGNWSLDGNYAAIFNVSIILLGILGIVSTYFIQRAFKNRTFTILVALISISAVGVGVVAENVFLPVHDIFALVLWVSAALAAFMSYKFEKSPLSYVSVVLGAVIVVAVFFFSLTDVHFGLGLGGLQRMINYPILLWLIGFGAYLIGDSNDRARALK